MVYYLSTSKYYKKTHVVHYRRNNILYIKTQWFFWFCVFLFRVDWGLGTVTDLEQDKRSKR